MMSSIITPYELHVIFEEFFHDFFFCQITADFKRNPQSRESSSKANILVQIPNDQTSFGELLSSNLAMALGFFYKILDILFSKLSRDKIQMMSNVNVNSFEVGFQSEIDF